MSDAAPAVTIEPIRIIPTPKPIESARPYERYEGPLSDLEVRLFDDAVDSKWQQHTLLEAALIAGGVGDATQLAESEERFERLVAKAAASIEKDIPADALATKLFAFMHREILVGGYELECTDLAATLKQGRFNCVSSTVLFNCLAERFGLDAIGMELPGHAMSRLHLNGEDVDVETTCPAWFRLQHDPQRRAALIAKTIGADVNAPGARPPREVSSVELVAMIYYNRGVDLLTARRFAEAAAANAKALRLDPSSDTARGNLLATLNNWAITLGAGQEYERAIDLLQQGMNLDPHYETFAANYVHLYYQWAETLCTQQDYQAALDVLGQASTTLLGSDRLSQLRQGVYHRWAREMIQQGKSRQALQLLQTADSEGHPMAGLIRPFQGESLADGPAAHTGEESVLQRGVDRQPESRLLNEH
jgi:tetratricopeptide (TPR) repeat protein